VNLIPITYHSKKYPKNVISNIDEIAGNFDKDIINPKREYSLHTEYSHMKRKLDNRLINKYPELKKSERENIPQLWKSKEWAREFANFIIELVGNNIPPKIIEIHPPFNDYCKNFSLFFDIYEEFEKIISAELPNTNIFIENRCGTFYKGGKFIISNGKSIIQFLQELEVRKLRLKLVLDYPQVFSAESIKMDDIKLKKIIEFNNNIKPYISHIGGFHLWGKRKSQTGRWTSHTGDLNTFFSNNNLLKDEFISSVVNTFDDNDIRFFVPEVNSSEEDLQSIIFDLLKYDVKFNFND
jgi:hypothetical protein